MNLSFDALIAGVGILVAIIAFAIALFQLRRQTTTKARQATSESPAEAGKNLIAAKGVDYTEVKRYSLQSNNATRCKIGIISGDILRVNICDIWVNGENTDMEMARFTENSISAIVRYHGAHKDTSGRVIDDTIAEELSRIVGTEKPVAPGSAFVTTSGSLNVSNNVRYIIHVAAVQGEPGSGFRQVRNVGLCVTNALREADRLASESPSIETIIFPLLGTGVGGGEVAPTVRTLIGAAINYLDDTPNTSLKCIYFLAYTELELYSFIHAIDTMFRLELDD